MGTTSSLGLLATVFGLTVAAHAQDTYPIAYNFQFIPRYEFVNAMTMSMDNKEYYTVFVIAFKNNGKVELPINDKYEIVTSKKENHTPGTHPFVSKDIQSRRKFTVGSGKIKPGETQYRVAIFDLISVATPAFKLYVHGLPDINGQPDRFQIIVDYEQVKAQWQLKKSARDYER